MMPNNFRNVAETTENATSLFLRACSGLALARWYRTFTRHIRIHRRRAASECSTIILGILLAMTACSAGALAASETGPIAVLDLKLNSTIQVLDDVNIQPKVKGTLNVFWNDRVGQILGDENRNTPLRLDGKLDLDRIRAAGPGSYGGSGSVEIKVRGASSLYHPKKQYSLDLKNFDFNKSVNFPAGSFLGMPADGEWVLHSCWADKTCLRNVIGYWLAAKLFPWAPRTEFAEVFINDEYRGLYVVIEKVKLAPSRVNLPLPDDNAFTGGISGTYILKRDAGNDFDWKGFYSGAPWWLVSPKSISPAQQDYIRDYMDVYFEAKFYPSSIAYSPWDYPEAMDEQSAADFIIIQEIANNVDAYQKSLHVTKYPFYYDNHFDDLVHMGPIWDLDLAFANYAYLDGTRFQGELEFDPKRMAAEVYAVCETNDWRIERQGGFQPLDEMWRIPQFRRAIYNRWWTLRSYATISRTRIEQKIDLFAARIASARARDDGVWHTLGKRTWWECWNKPTYQAEITALKSWIRERITWMDQQLLNFQ